jgi:hypothetical protein
MGKAGHRALIEFWVSTNCYSAEAREKYVAETLSDLRFVFQFPDAYVSAETSR